MKKCGTCDKEVPSYDIDRWRDCKHVRLKERRLILVLEIGIQVIEN
tara:strand:+ start:59 stop:196 length:138 start_codon:yes stop_codon:yes gene_type:complete